MTGPPPSPIPALNSIRKLLLNPTTRLLLDAVEQLARVPYCSANLLAELLNVTRPAAQIVLNRLEQLGVVGPPRGDLTRRVHVDPGCLKQALAAIKDGQPFTPPPASRRRRIAIPLAAATGRDEQDKPRKNDTPASPQPAVTPTRAAQLHQRAMRGTPEPLSAEQRERMLALHRDAAAIYRANLSAPRAAGVRAYLDGRGLTPAIEPFGIGYAMPGWTTITNQLRHAGYSDQELVASGLSIATKRQDKETSVNGDDQEEEKKDLIDRYRNRIMMPYTDEQGRVIAFLGRAGDHRNDKTPKYMNATNTGLWAKHAHLFGWGQTHRCGGPIIIVEGPTDVMAVRLATAHLPVDRQPLVVAACGTAITSEHIGLLLTVAGERELILATDGDKAGQKALARADEHIRDQGWPGPCSAIEYADGTDPAELLREHGTRAVLSAFTRRRPLIDVLIDHRLRRVLDDQPPLVRESPVGQHKAAWAIVTLLARCAPADVPGQAARLAERGLVPLDAILHVYVSYMERPAEARQPARRQDTATAQAPRRVARTAYRGPSASP